MWVIGKASRRRKGAHCRFARATGGGFPKSCGRGLSAKGADGVPRGSRYPAPPRHATRSWPKAFGQKTGESRLYGSFTKDLWYYYRLAKRAAACSTSLARSQPVLFLARIFWARTACWCASPP